MLRERGLLRASTLRASGRLLSAVTGRRVRRQMVRMDPRLRPFAGIEKVLARPSASAADAGSRLCGGASRVRFSRSAEIPTRGCMPRMPAFSGRLDASPWRSRRGMWPGASWEASECSRSRGAMEKDRASQERLTSRRRQKGGAPSGRRFLQAPEASQDEVLADALVVPVLPIVEELMGVVEIRRKISE